MCLDNTHQGTMFMNPNPLANRRRVGTTPKIIFEHLSETLATKRRS